MPDIFRSEDRDRNMWEASEIVRAVPPKRVLLVCCAEMHNPRCERASKKAPDYLNRERPKIKSMKARFDPSHRGGPTPARTALQLPRVAGPRAPTAADEGLRAGLTQRPESDQLPRIRKWDVDLGPVENGGQ